MTFYREDYSLELVAEMMPLWVAHYEETKDKLYPVLDPHLDMYFKSAQAGILRVYTMRNEGDLCGYEVFFVTAHLHSKNIRQAIQDILYVKPEHRKGFEPVMFMRWCMEQLKAEAVDLIVQVLPVKNSYPRVMDYLGYEVEDIMYAKKLQEIA